LSIKRAGQVGDLLCLRLVVDGTQLQLHSDDDDVVVRATTRSSSSGSGGGKSSAMKFGGPQPTLLFPFPALKVIAGEGGGGVQRLVVEALLAAQVAPHHLEIDDAELQQPLAQASHHCSPHQHAYSQTCMHVSTPSCIFPQVTAYSHIFSFTVTIYICTPLHFHVFPHTLSHASHFYVYCHTFKHTLTLSCTHSHLYCTCDLTPSCMLTSGHTAAFFSGLVSTKDGRRRCRDRTPSLVIVHHHL
jgi:hypothetical protein